MEQIKKHIIVFLIGITIGVFFGCAIYGAIMSEQVDAVTTLDSLIDEWCSNNDSLIVFAQSNGIQIAGIPARKELPDARPHYFPDTVRSLASWLENQYRIPKAFTLAQFALESKWGTSNLNSSNYFGHTFNAVKSFMQTPKFIWAREQRVVNGLTILGDSVRFANYQNIKECFLVHGIYLHQSTRYKKAFAQSSQFDFAREIAKAGYATDPQYAVKLITIMKRYHLE